MATYAIGDVQGCLQPLLALLEQIQFDPNVDNLWFAGDLINRGPQSLETLRFIKSLGDKHISVLGNHDLHLLAVAYGVDGKGKHDTLNDILLAPDKDELLEWLRNRPLLHTDNTFVMTHAGLAPAWSLDKARQLAHEAESILRSSEMLYYLQHMYGNQPDNWSDDLSGEGRFRCIINYFTRMRYCYPDGRLDLEVTTRIADKPAHLLPWFGVPGRKNTDVKIIFGHWAALEGKTDTPNTFALDTGCVWGRALTALRLEDEQRFSVRCHK